MQLDSTHVLVTAVRRMIPRNALGRSIMKKLHAYPGSAHPHQAQAPKALDLT
jgi:large subunit ribosomal protein L13